MSIAGKAAVSHDYEAKNGNLLKSTYANGWEVAYTYDNLDRVTEVKAAKDGTSYTIGRYIYDKLGRVARFIDGQVSGKSCTYGYDLTDRLCEAVFDDGTAYRYTYDANDCLIKEVQTTPDGVRTVTRGYDADSRETSVACGSAKVEKTFDKLGRLSSIKRNGGKHTTTYTYETTADGGQTGRVKTVKNGSGTWEYAYDAWGNVSKATENGSADSHTYTYDAQGQLTREYDPDKKLYLGYQYDAGGNLTEVRSYPAGAEGGPEGTGTVLKTFAYDSTWKDQLTAVTMDGRTRNFTYDANGNLLSDGNYTYSWTKGSQLQKVTGSGLEATYTYDASGIRTSKTVNGVTTEYLTAGGSVLSEKKNGVWQHYLYDGSGQLMAIRYKGADYYYIRDGLMSITGLVDANGVAVVNYRYDSWGILTGITGSMAGTLGKDNPYRFKGYYYDEETGMYYLKSRYYQPEICRFISADSYDVLTQSPMALVDTNLYNYCDNNPVYREDENGQFWNIVIPALIGAAVGTFLTWAATSATGQEYRTKDYLSDFVAGFIINLIPIKNISRAFYVIYTTGKGIYDGEEPKSIAFNAAIAWTASSLNISERLNLPHKTNYDKVANNVMDVVENAGREFVGAITSRIFNSDPLKTKSSKSVKNSFKRTLISNQIIRKGKKVYRKRVYYYRGRKEWRIERIH